MPPQFNLSRRGLLQAAGPLLLSPGAVLASGEARAGHQIFISAATVDDTHTVRAFSVAGGAVQTLFSHELPGRAHHVAVHAKSGRYVVVARRPGTWMATGRITEQSAPKVLALPSGRRTCGHGFFTEDGSDFLSVETSLDQSRDDGLLVSWKVDSEGQMKRYQEFTTSGIGPHEAVLMHDDRTVVIANGGYRTDGGQDRGILNLDTMTPSLVYLDRISGQVLQKVTLDAALHQNSIRHLDVNRAGQVVFAMQFEGEPFLDVPLVAMHEPGQRDAVPLTVPLFEQQQLNQYCGSVRFDESGRYAAVSAPRGNRITFWNVVDKTFVSSVRSRDGCGVCAWGGGFVFTSGTGRISFLDLGSGKVTELSAAPGGLKLNWDNHLSRV